MELLKSVDNITKVLEAEEGTIDFDMDAKDFALAKRIKQAAHDHAANSRATQKGREQLSMDRETANLHKDKKRPGDIIDFVIDDKPIAAGVIKSVDDLFASVSVSDRAKQVLSQYNINFNRFPITPLRHVGNFKSHNRFQYKIRK